MARDGIKSRSVSQTEPRIRRGYFECRYGQLHVRNAIPPGGGFEEGISLLLLHHYPMSGAVYQRLLSLMGRDRSVYAPDLPGFGESDAPPSPPSIADYAGAVADFLDTMRFRQVDVAAYQSGSLVAAELAIARPACVRRVVCVGVPVASKAERDSFRAAPWPIPAVADGGHLAVEWERTRKGGRSALPLAALARHFAEKLHNGPDAWWGMQAALDYPARDRLGRVTQPVLLVRARDEHWDTTQYARELMPKARLTDLPDVGDEAFESAPERMAEILRGFLQAR
ncbi:MAG: alpha/beta hydrolase [Steroidobacteraceae bacterium]